MGKSMCDDERNLNERIAAATTHEQQYLKIYAKNSKAEVYSHTYECLTSRSTSPCFEFGHTSQLVRNNTGKRVRFMHSTLRTAANTSKHQTIFRAGAEVGAVSTAKANIVG
jgi:hypothetical protein